MACTANCETQDHESWGQCLRDKGLRIAAVDSTTNGYTNGGSE